MPGGLAPDAIPQPLPEAPGSRRRGQGPSRRSPRRPSVFWRLRNDIPSTLRVTLVLVSLVVPFAAWSILYLLRIVDPIFLPSPVRVLGAMGDMVRSGEIFTAAGVSLQRILIGFGLAVLVSVPLGLAMGSFRSIQSLFEPMIGLVRYMPATAFVPLLLIWLGLGETPKIALIFIGTVFFNSLMTANVVWQIPNELIKVSYTLGASNFTVFRKVVLPHALPGMVDAARVNLAAAWNLIVVAELLAASEGLGFRIVRAQKFLQIDKIFALLIVIGIIGVTTDILLHWARKRMSPWASQ
ncbi:MAG TPA: ABC transporter permease [Dehalococcoidia bacterium]|nr:ABC transporter permease [Dehalococcoidia bacterium]